MTEQLADKKCVPCRGGVPALEGEQLEKLHQSVPLWNVDNQHHLHREFKFPDFKQALDFVNKVGALAEEQGHHPDILLVWGKSERFLPRSHLAWFRENLPGHAVIEEPDGIGHVPPARIAGRILRFARELDARGVS